MRNRLHIKLISLAIVAFVLISLSTPAFAELVATKTITLKEAIDTAITTSSALKLIDDKIKVAERRYNTAVAVSKDAASKYWGSDTQHIANKKEELLYPAQKEATLNDLKWQKDNTAKQLKLDITDLYHRIQLKQQQIDAQTKAIQRAKDEYAAKNSEVKVGTSTDSALLPLKIAIDSAETKLLTMQRDKEKLIMDLNKKVGFDVTQQLTLKNEILPDVKLDIDIEQTVKDVVAKMHSVTKLESDKDLVKKEYDIIMGYSMKEKPEDKEPLEDKLLSADYDIRDKKIAEEYKIRADYNSLLSLKDDITIKQLEYEKALKLFDITKVKYGIGMATSLEYIKAEGDASDAWVGRKQAMLDYYLAVEKFKNYITP